MKPIQEEPVAAPAMEQPKPAHAPAAVVTKKPSILDNLDDDSFSSHSTAPPPPVAATKKTEETKADPGKKKQQEASHDEVQSFEDMDESSFDF
jgi:hypothetical protein